MSGVAAAVGIGVTVVRIVVAVAGRGVGETACTELVELTVASFAVSMVEGRVTVAVAASRVGVAGGIAVQPMNRAAVTSSRTKGFVRR
jgi:hypothetical protein